MLLFELQPHSPKAKTFAWTVSSGGVLLGKVAWFNHWRRYCFYPNKDTLFDVTCLNEVIQFIEQQTELRRDLARTIH